MGGIQHKLLLLSPIGRFPQSPLQMLKIGSNTFSGMVVAQDIFETNFKRNPFSQGQFTRLKQFLFETAADYSAHATLTNFLGRETTSDALFKSLDQAESDWQGTPRGIISKRWYRGKIAGYRGNVYNLWLKYIQHISKSSEASYNQKA